MNSKILTYSLSCIFLLSFLLLGLSSSASSKTLSYANFPPASTFPSVQMERWADEVEERTNGKITINTFPGGSLIGAKAMMDGVIQGQADIGCLCMAYQPGRFKITNAVSLPLPIPNAKVGSQVLLDLYNKYKPKSFEKVKVLAMFTTAPSNIMSKKPIRKLDDLKGLDLRASGGAAQILNKWGANQVGMPMSEVPEALQKGVIQGLFSSVEVMKDFKFANICKYITITKTSVYPFAVVMNMSTWNSLSPDVQKVMNELIREQSVWTGNYMTKHVKESVEWSKEEKNVEVIQLSQQKREKWNQLLKPITKNWIKKSDKQGLPAQDIINDIRDLAQKYKQEN